MAIIDGWTLPWPEIRIPLYRAGRAKLAALRTRRVGRRGGLQIFVVAAPVQCPDLLAAAPRNRRLELERADRCLSRKGDGSRVRIGLAGGNSSRRPA
jgi:hypothetical protein